MDDNKVERKRFLRWLLESVNIVLLYDVLFHELENTFWFDHGIEKTLLECVC